MSDERLDHLMNKPIKELTNREFKEMGGLFGDDLLTYGGEFDNIEIADDDELFWQESGNNAHS